MKKKKGNDCKRLAYNRQGNRLNISVKNENWETIYSRKDICIKDKKAMLSLAEDLRNVGVDLSKFDKEAKGMDWW